MDALVEFVGESPQIVALRKQIRRLLQQQAPTRRIPSILIQGETGTGKGLLARVMHKAGPRANGPFVDVNCAAIPETLLEAELFGYERGAFTDARQAKAGLFQTAHGGTLFLDEIGLLPRGLQAKLLTVLEQSSVRRLGATRSEPANVAIIAATNEDLRAAVQAGRVREDLYHRLAVITLDLPPLRERPGDVELLADIMIARVCADYGLAPCTLAPDAREALRRHAWPGNVRELGNTIERAALLSDGPTLTAAIFHLPTNGPAVAGPAPSIPQSMRQRGTREQLIEALDGTAWNIARTAALLGITRNTVRAQIKRYALRPAAEVVERHPAGAEEHQTTDSVEAAVVSAVTSRVRWEYRRVAFVRVRILTSPKTPPATTAHLLDEFIEKIESFGGCVEDLAQRSLVAIFGHESMEDAPRCGANAALAILNAVERGRVAGGSSGASVACALHVGRAAVARIGTRVALDEDAKREAARVLDAIEPTDGGQLAVSDAALGFLARHFDLQQPADGAGGAHRLIGRRSTASVQPDAFVGRQWESDLLHGLLDRALLGQGQVVTIVGEPGIGKSRLLQEFRRAIQTAGVVTVEGRCASYGTHVPYFPILEILQAVCEIEEADPPEKVDAKVVAALRPLGDHAAVCAPYVQHLLAPRSPAALSDWNPEAIKARTFEALRHIIVAETERQALLVVIEDLHWIDQTSEELLTSLAEIIGATRTLLVTTCRPEYQPPWAHRSNATQITIGRLSASESRRVVESVLGTLTAETLVATIVGRAEGNPFFLEELARAARGQDTALLAVPETIHDVLAARIEGLSEADRHIIHLAAVLGRDAPLPILQDASGVSSADLRASLGRLQSGDFLYPSRVGVDAQYTFRHALTHDVAYDSVPDDSRALLHERAAAVIEKLAPETRERRPETLARHYTAAGRRREAIDYWFRAGQLAIQRSAYPDAIVHLTEALTLLEGEPASPEQAARELRLQLALAASLTATRGFAAAAVETALARIRFLSDQLGDPVQQFAVCWSLWRFYLTRADFRSGEEMVVQLLAISESQDDPVQRFGAFVAAGVDKFYMGGFARARAYFEDATRLYDRSLSTLYITKYGQDPGAVAWGFLGWAHGIAGDVEDAAAYAQRALDLAREIQHPFSLAFALLLASEIYELRREPARVQPLGEEIIRLAHEQALPFFSAIGLIHAGWARAAGDDSLEGIAMMEEGSALFLAAGQRVGLMHRARLAEALIGCGRVDDGYGIVTDALARADESQEGAFVAEHLRLQGEVHIRRGKPSEGMTSFKKALDVATRQGAWMFALRTATALAQVDPSARAGLATIVLRFPPALETPDLNVARKVLGTRQ